MNTNKRVDFGASVIKKEMEVIANKMAPINAPCLRRLISEGPILQAPDMYSLIREPFVSHLQHQQPALQRLSLKTGLRTWQHL